MLKIKIEFGSFCQRYFKKNPELSDKVNLVKGVYYCTPQREFITQLEEKLGFKLNRFVIWWEFTLCILIDNNINLRKGGWTIYDKFITERELTNIIYSLHGKTSLNQLRYPNIYIKHRVYKGLQTLKALKILYQKINILDEYPNVYGNPENKSKVNSILNYIEEQLNSIIEEKDLDYKDLLEKYLRLKEQVDYYKENIKIAVETLSHIL